MSRRRKLLLFFVVLPLVLVAVLLSALFLPAVQTFAARKALAGQGGDVERVSVGLGGATLTGLRIEQPGLKLSMPSFRAEAPLTDLVGGKVDVRAIVAHDIVIELDPVAMQAAQKPAATPAKAEPTKPAKPFNGVLDTAQLPELRVDGIDLAGRLRVAGPQPVDATFALTGGGIHAGQAGKLELKVEAKAGLGSVVTTFTLVPTLGADGRLDALGAVAEALATSKLLAQPARLSAKIDIARQAGGTGETYALRLLAGETPLVELDTRWAPGATELPGRWKIALRDKDIAPFALGLALPDFTLSGGGELAILGTEKLRLGGDLNLAADGLEMVGLPKLGPVSLTSKFAVEGGQKEARVDLLKVDFNGTSPVLAIETRQPFSVALDTMRLTPGRDAAAELAEVRLLGVPAAWVKLFVPDLSLGGAVTGSWTVRPEGDGFLVNSVQPLIVPGLAYASEGKPLVAFESVRVEGLRVKQTSAGLEATVGALRVIADGADLVAGKLEATQKPNDPLLAKGEFRALLAKLADQPVLRGQTRLSAGQAVITFDASVDAVLKTLAQVRITGLRASGAGDLPEVSLDADLARDAAGVIVAKLPLSVRNAKANRVSDLLLDTTITPGATETHIAAKLGSQVLFVEDLQAFAALAAQTPPATPPPSSPKPAPQPPPTPTAPVQPVGPLWAGTTGEVELALARIVYAPGIELANTNGRLALTRDAASLEALRTILGTGGSLGATGALKWSPAAKTYTLGADVAGKDVVVGTLLKAFSPGEAAKLEGTYDLTATVSGRGADPGAAAAGAAADLRLIGKQGVIRAINLDTNKYARAGSVVSGLAGLAGLAGARIGNEEMVQQANRVTALNAVARALGNLAYDEIVIEAKRVADGSIEIGKLNLVSPQIRLAGGGSLKAVPGRSWYELPLNLRADLGARGELAQHLAALRLLSLPEADAGGTLDAYAAVTEPLVFDGTLGQVGTAQIMRLLTRAVGL